MGGSHIEKDPAAVEHRCAGMFGQEPVDGFRQIGRVGSDCHGHKSPCSSAAERVAIPRPGDDGLGQAAGPGRVSGPCSMNGAVCFERMSLKAKLEAVIYAADEPVTLAQLVALFSEEALAEASTSAPATMELETGRQPEIGLGASEGLWPEGVAPAQGMEGVADTQPSTAASQAEGSVEPAAEASGAELADQAAADQAADEKQAARQRERKIRDALKQILDSLIAEYSAGDRGMEIREIAGGYRMATKPEYHDTVRRFVKSLKPPLRLSLPALETLAVVAYKQPVTSPEVSEIRGVDSGGVLGSLIARKLIATAGRKQVIGRPILYKTTREFLLRFGLKDLGDLPSMEEFEKMATELAEGEPQNSVSPDTANLPFESPAQPTEQLDETGKATETDSPERVVTRDSAANVATEEE